jgi:light-regulated signal transduction histidine kinase (bacteriophytochrome)
MPVKSFNADKFGDIFPHMENILHCGIFSHNVQTNESYWSAGMFTILGIELNSIASTPENFLKFVNEEDRDMVIEAGKKFNETKIPYQVEFSITDAKGLQKRVYSENYIKVNAAGEMLEYNGVIKDITESFYYKKALEQKVAQLDKSNHNLQEFVYVASHDLQEPLRKISTFTERLGSKFQSSLGQEGTMYVNRILNATNNMQVLLQDLLNFSRLSFNDRPFEMISIKQVVESVLADLEIKIEETKAVIACDDLPDIEAYSSQIKQLFNNLITNALKFRRQHEPPTIKIACGNVYHDDYPELPLIKNAKYVKILVEDNGIGFEQEFSERIFMIFQRLNGKAEYAGSGIGLSICKKIVENHHGFIFATGIPEQGATFTILLPQKQS